MLPTRLLAVGVLSLLVACDAPGNDAGPTPLSTEPAASSPTPSSAAVVDGTVVALIEAGDGTTVTWDRIDVQADACTTVQSEVATYREFFETCYSNPDRTLRSAPVSPSARVVVRPGNGPERTVGPDQLPVEISAEAANDIPRRYRAWRITLKDGRVVLVEQARGAGSATSGAEATTPP